MEIYVLDQALERIGVVDIYESFIWSSTYNNGGSWELRCPMGYFSLLQAERIIQSSVDDRCNGLIEYVEKVEDEEGVETLLVKGRMLEALLERRVIRNPIVYESQQPSAIIKSVAERNLSLASGARQVENFKVQGAPTSDLGAVSYAGGNITLLDSIKSLTSESQLGFAVTADDINKEYILNLYKGENRTEEGNISTEVVVEEINNMLANGDFTGGMTGWQEKYNTRAFNFRTQEHFGPYPMTVAGGIVSKGKVCSIGDDGKLYDIWKTSPHAYQTPTLSKEHIYYMAARFSNPTDSVIGFGIGEDGACILNSGRTSGYVKMASLFVPEETGPHTFYMGLGDLADKDNQFVYMDYGLLVDLTATFGAGSEPGLDYCRDNIYQESGAWKYKKQLISFAPNGNDPLAFSRDRDTLIEIEYSKNIANEKNVLYIHGDGMDAVVISEGLSGWNRKEACLDLSGIERTLDGVEIPAASYKAMLEREGRAALRKMVVSELIDGKYYLLSNKRYRQDFHLGDLVNCVDRIGVEATLRITETTEVWDSSGYSLAITLGDDVPDIYETIKLVAKGAK